MAPRQLWRYRDLVGLFVWRDFVAVHKQTILGPAWHILQPLCMTIIFTLVFSRVARLSTDGAPPFLFYMAGTVALGILRHLSRQHGQDLCRERAATR